MENDLTVSKNGIKIKGIEKSSLLDYPGKVCTIVFLPDCNFRCGFCHNPDLINQPDKLPNFPEKELFDLLESRGKWVDAVTISGGEPTLHSGLPAFIKRIKGLTHAKHASGQSEGFLVQLDTNGSNPRMLKQLIDEHLLDYIAMDIKGPLEKYAEIAEVPVDLKKIEQSIDIIRNSGIDYEFRTTIVPKQLNKDDIAKIGQWLKCSKRFALQQFRPANTLDPSFQNETPYNPKELESFKKLLETYFDMVEVRGI